MVVFLNGEFVPGEKARIGVLTHGFSYGTGCFEGIRGYWNPEQEEVYLFRARAHYKRLHESCRILNIALPYTVDELIEINRELARRNGFHENCYFRPYAYKADEMIGVKLHDLRDDFVMIGQPMGMYVRTDGLRCTVSSWRRVDDNAIPARAKVAGAYVNSALAKTDAQRSGFDEAIMLTSEGHVSEGSAENIFLVKGRDLITPPPSENILLGVTRDTVMQLAERELGMHTHQRIIDRTELYTMDEIFLTGTACEIAPVIEVDHRPIGTGGIGLISGQIQRLYADVVRGKRPEYSEWNTPVYGEAVALPRAHAHTETAAVVASANGSNGANGKNGANGHAKHASNGHSTNGHQGTAPSAASSNGHASNGHASNGHTASKTGSNGHSRVRKPRTTAGSASE